MTNKLRLTDEDQKRIDTLSTLFAGLPEEDDPDFDTLSQFDQEFLASTKRQFDIWQDLTINQEDYLVQVWLKWRERERQAPHD